jgi:hypothetical protein
MPVLVVPGVSVEATFDILPPLPAAAGIVGIVGVVDRPPTGRGLVSVSRVSELADQLGRGTLSSLPEGVQVLQGGGRELVVSPVAGGAAASVALSGADGNASVTLRARANGAWANALRAEVDVTFDAARTKVVGVSVHLLKDGRIIERFDDLVIDPSSGRDLIDVVNAQSKYVVALDSGGMSDKIAKTAQPVIVDADAGVSVKRSGGGDFYLVTRGEDLKEAEVVKIGVAVSDDRAKLSVFVDDALVEEFPDLGTDPDDARYILDVIAAGSRRVRLQRMLSRSAADMLLQRTTSLQAFAGGAEPDVNAYTDAIALLTEDPRIDLVLASFHPDAVGDLIQVQQALLAHAVARADAAEPRIAFGSIMPAEAADPAAIRAHAAQLRNRRFVLVAPAGAEGAVVGAIARVEPQISPTFKPALLGSIPPATFRESQLNVLLGPLTNLLVVQERVGRGVVVLKGIDTTGDQISVTRVADRAIRETKAIAENFIGALNSDEARAALKQQLIGMFTRLERAGAIVPSTDGTDPAFLVDVYSTGQDFSQGIVRIDIAVRPVRAIDYVYATIRVKN